MYTRKEREREREREREKEREREGERERKKGRKMPAQTRDASSFSADGVEIAPRDSQTERINANNWILPAISVSLERRAAQLRNAPRRLRGVGGGRDAARAPEEVGRPCVVGRGKEKRKRVPVLGESLSCLRPRHASPARSHPARRLAVIYSVYFMRELAVWDFHGHLISYPRGERDFAGSKQQKGHPRGIPPRAE